MLNHFLKKQSIFWKTPATHYNSLYKYEEKNSILNLICWICIDINMLQNFKVIVNL